MSSFPPSSSPANSSSGLPAADDKKPGTPHPPDGSSDGGGASKRHVWVWVAVMLLIIGGIVLYRMHSSSVAAAKSKDTGNQTVSVGVTAVQQRDVPFYLTGLGSVTAYNTVTVHTRVDGQIMQVFFKEGQLVRAGDVHTEIDPRPY